MNESDTLALAKQLIAQPSVTPDDAQCQALLAERLSKLGFQIESLPFGEVTNMWARLGTQAPLFVFAGHTDVVPTGPEQQWRFPPFEPTIDDGQLYGRGSADMKSSIAAMCTATERFVAEHNTFNGSIAFLITSDEEGPSINGTVKVVETLEQRNEKIDWCLVGEPSSTDRVGDIIKNGRRGSLGGKLVIHGQQGHVAYPHLAHNPIHAASAAIAALCEHEWDQGNDHFPPTTFQISNIHAGTGATNVIPGELIIDFNFRFSTEVTDQQLRDTVKQLLEHYELEYSLEWKLSGQPFITEQGDLVNATQHAIREVCDYDTQLSTSGGTSDGRFIAPTGAQVVELGPTNATIHQIDEHTDVAQLDQLSRIYQRILEKLLT